MTLTELRYIVAVARERHFGRAAEVCHVAQPTLSVAVKKLEDELGVAIFERGKTDIGITPVGERIIAQAQRVLEEAEAIKQVAHSGQDQLSGPLRLGAIYTIGPYLFPHLVPVLHEAAPKMPLLIEENYTTRLTERLKQGELDAIVIALPFDEPGIVTLPLYDEPFVAVLPTDHPWTKRKLVSVHELSAETLLLLGQGHCFRDQVLNVCPACNRSAQGLARTVEGSSLETIRHMVASGLGITVLPCTATGAGHYQQKLLSFRPFDEPVPYRRVALAWRASFPRPKAIEAVRQAIQQCRLGCVSYV